MKITTLFLATVCLVSVTAFAIDVGPGGRLWSAGNDSVNGGVFLNDIILGSDWNASGNSMNAEGFFRQNAGLNGDHWGNYFVQSVTPVLSKMAGTGFGTVTFGFNGTAGAPSSTHPNSSGVPSVPVMQIIKVKPGSPVEYMTRGRAYVNDSTPSTDGGLHAWYDRTGLFSGSKGSYYFQSTWGWGYTMGIIGSTTPDIADQDSDYLFFLGRNWNDIQDSAHDQLGSRIYATNMAIQKPWAGQVYAAVGHSVAGTYYLTYAASNNSPKQTLWYDSTSPAGIRQTTSSRITTGTIKDATGYHSATWTLAADSTGNANGILLCVDRNNDGDAMDTGEASVIYDNNSSTVDMDNIVAVNNKYDGTNGMKFVVGPNGKNFLILANSYQQYLTVLQLNADGTFAGAGAAVPNDYVKVQYIAGLRKEISFDYYVPGDTTGDLICNGQDIFGFLKALSSEEAFRAYSTTVTMKGADTNDDGVVNGQDIKPFLDALAGTASAAPEPMSLALLGLGGFGLLRRKK